MLDTFVIGIREGLEAALIVSILVAYLVKIERRDEIGRVFLGLALAIAIAVATGFGLSLIDSELSDTAEPVLSGIFSLLAAGFVTWMIFWMARQSRTMGAELHAKVDSAGTAIGLAGVAFFAVLREGVETALFIWARVRSSSDSNIWGALFGLAVAALLGFLVYKGAVKLHLGVFFKWTGAFLILVAAGVFTYGVHELQEVGILPFLTSAAYDVSGAIPDNSFWHVVLGSTVAFNTSPSVLEVICWVAFVAPISVLYIRQYRKH